MVFPQLAIDGLRMFILFAAATAPSTREQSGRGHWTLSALGGGFGSVTLNNLDPKRMPVELELDDDSKDIKVKGNRRFRPAKKEAGNGPKRQLQLRAKRPDAEACVAGSFKGSGSSSSRVRMSIDLTTGLVDGQSRGFLEIRHGDGVGLVVYRVEAVWNAAIDGFSVRARRDGQAVGSTHDLKGAHQLLLFARQSDADFSLSAAVAGFDEGSWDDEVQVYNTLLDDEAANYCGAFGAAGLDKKGSIYFANLALDGDPQRLGLTDAEKQLAFNLQYAGTACGNCEVFADPHDFMTNIILARDWAVAGEFAWASAQTLLKGLIEDGTIAGKRAKRMKLSVRRGVAFSKRAAKLAQKLVDKGKGPGDSSAPLEHLGQWGRNLGDLATAQITGFNSSSVDHVYDWATF
ncbi:MAG: hypothetical protein DRQ55_04830 [Planctomycetota bacterium]|nr:MAG: hypothetical protein DRQ55_04830 [Planctomycetota bacterium]